MQKKRFSLSIGLVLALIIGCSVDSGGSGGGSGGGGTPTPDTTPPSLTIQQPTNGAEVGGVYTLSGTVTDDKSGVKAVYVAVDDDTVFSTANVVNGSWSTNITLSSYGPHTNYVYAEDNEGNVIATNVIEVIRAAVPALVITDPVEGFITKNASVTLSGTVSIENPYTISKVEVSLDGVNYTEATYVGGNWSI